MAIGWAPIEVLSVVDFDTWAARDRLLAARPNPLAIGVGDRALACLAERAPEVAAGFGPWWDGVVARAEEWSRQVDEGSPDVHDVATGRAESLAALQRLTTALVAATGGAAMARTDPAQRLAREALFYVIQAQSPDGRAATLAHLGPGDAGP